MSVLKGTSLSAGNPQGVVSSGTSPTWRTSVCQPPTTLSQDTSISMPKVQALIFNIAGQGRIEVTLVEATWKVRHRDTPEPPALSGAKMPEPAWKSGSCACSEWGGLVCTGDSRRRFLPLHLYLLSALLVWGWARPLLLIYSVQPRCE